mmetsp:Transcript_12957/g.24350  ORF Transcript_12957/g.24350 Transcript_12957/m.24350 type:complete len:456 (-) Transcript_12957:54-1421(-)
MSNNVSSPFNKTRMAANIPFIVLSFAKDVQYTYVLSKLISTLLSNTFGAYCSLHRKSMSDLDVRLLLGELQTLPIRHRISPEFNFIIRSARVWIAVREESSMGLQYLGFTYHTKKSQKLYLFVLLHLLWMYVVDRVKIGNWGDMWQTPITFRYDSSWNTKCTVHLKGVSRQQAFKAMRQKMMESARSLDNALMQKEFSQQYHRPNELRSTNNCTETCVFRNKLAIIQRCFKTLSDQSYGNFSTPHDLSTRDNHNIFEQEMFHDAADLMQRDAMRLASVLKWLMRVNIGIFYLNGHYPSILHRITGMTIEKDDTFCATILADVPSYHTVGLLILLESFSKLAQVSLDIVLDRWYESTDYKQREVQNVRHHSRSTTSCQLEHTVPSTRNTVTESQSTLEEDCCVICMNRRQSSAASTVCGHVFCWYCIHQFIATVRPECPLCRKSCKHQEVISLCNY